jgi:putative membrane protein
MSLRLSIIALLGVALVAYLVFSIGFAAVLAAVLAVGWGGFGLLCALSLLFFVPLGAAWHVLIEGFLLKRFAVFVWGRMVRDAASEVLPFSQVGGFIIGARALILHGTPAPLAFGSTIVDVTTEMMAQIAYVAFGIALFSRQAPASAFTHSLLVMLIAGSVVAAIAGGLFILVQQSGIWITEKLANRWLPEQVAHAAAVAAAIDTIYRAPVRIGLSVAIHVVGWIASAGLSWTALRLMGAAVDFGAVVAIDSLVFAARSAAFIVPNALGVQEAAYVMLAPLCGVGPELGLAVSLLKRARDLAIGGPVLVAWQAIEGSHALAAARSDGKLWKPD